MSAVWSRRPRREDRQHGVRGIAPELEQRHVVGIPFQLDEALQRRELDAHSVQGCFAVEREELCGQNLGVAVSVHRPSLEV
jgi:hypothetical protein